MSIRRVLPLLMGVTVAALSLLTPGIRPAPAYAVPVANTYEGSMSDGGTVEATTNQDGSTVSLSFSFKGGASGCPLVVAIPTARLDTAGMAVRADREPTTAGAVSVAAFFDVTGYYALVGSVAVDPSAAQSGCTRRASFRAGISSGALPLGIGHGTALTAGGNVFAVGSDTPGGTVKIATNDGGTGISTFDFNYQQGSCTYGGSIGRPLSYDAGPSLESKEGGAQAWTFVIASTPDSLNGGIASDVSRAARGLRSTSRQPRVRTRHSSQRPPRRPRRLPLPPRRLRRHRRRPPPQLPCPQARRRSVGRSRRQAWGSPFSVAAARRNW